MRWFGVTLAIGLCLGSSVPAASETWTCTQRLGAKTYPTKYVVSDKYLIIGDGSSASKILFNDDHLLISFWRFKQWIHVRPKNSRSEVEVQEVFTKYIVIDKARNRMMHLYEGLASIFAGNEEILESEWPDAELTSLPCARE